MHTSTRRTQRKALNCRLATPFEGPVIGSLLRASGKTDRGVNWNVNVFPYWLIAELDGQPIACVQIHYGVPIARIDTMCLPDGLSKIERTRVAHKLSTACIDIARATGAQYVTASINEAQYPLFGRYLEKRFGARRIRDGALYVAQVR